MVKRTDRLGARRPLLRVDPATGQLQERTYFVNVLSGPDAGITVELEGSLTVGTFEKAGLVLKDSTVSRYHVEFRPRSEGVQVIDLRSTNGTFLAGIRIQEVTVEQEAHFKIGQTVLRVWLRDRDVDDDKAPRKFGPSVSDSPPMRKLFGILQRVALSDCTVLFQGETGVGKDLLARATHAASARKEGPWVVRNCGALTPELIESELFGHARGAFTGADKERNGAFLEARQGTLFLDDIGELPLELQPKLLRALDTGRIKPLGQDAEREVDVRVMAATHRDLEAEVKAGRFRQDLFFRLSVVPVHVPPLRDRREDIPQLIRQMVGEGEGQLDVSDEVLALYAGYRWPGNVRELRNVVERAMVGAELQPPGTAPRTSSTGSSGDMELPFKVAKQQHLDSFTRAYLENLLVKCGRNVTKMSQSAGIARHYLRELLDRYGIDASDA
jgi:two-component system, NtrC family, response regulator GlrR